MGRNAKRIKDIGGMTQILLDLKPKRSLGELYVNQKIDVTNLVKYSEEIKKDKDNKITLFHLFSMAIAKTIYHRPYLNRFVSNRHMFEHNDITLSFVTKVAFEDKSKEIMVIIPFDEKDTLKSVSKKIKDKINDIRSKKSDGEGANDAINILGKLPNIIRVPLVGILKLFDKYGILPSSLVKDNIYYSSIIISDVGVLKCGGIYHNITDFGTCSGLATIGEIKKEIVNKEERYYCELGITIDERIADGFYFIKSIHLIEYLLNNPKLLEESLDTPVEIEEKIKEKK